MRTSGPDDCRLQRATEFRLPVSSKSGIPEASSWFPSTKTIMGGLEFHRIARRISGKVVVFSITPGTSTGCHVLKLSIVDAMLLRPLPFPDPDREVYVSGVNAKRAAASSSWGRSDRQAPPNSWRLERCTPSDLKTGPVSNAGKRKFSSSDPTLRPPEPRKSRAEFVRAIPAATISCLRKPLSRAIAGRDRNYFRARTSSASAAMKPKAGQ